MMKLKFLLKRLTEIINFDLTKKVLSQNTQLSVASCLDSKEEKIISLSIGEWKKKEINLNKKPTVFLIDAK